MTDKGFLSSPQAFRLAVFEKAEYRIKDTRYALEGIFYVVDFYLKSTESWWILRKVFNFSAPLELGCHDCHYQNEDGVLSKGQVPIPIAIGRYGPMANGRP